MTATADDKYCHHSSPFRRLQHALLVCAMALLARQAGADEKAMTESLPLPAPAQFVTHHQVNIHGTKIAFTATAGETYLYSDKNEPIGSIFSYAYVRDGVASNKRPVMFLVGGGPGAASFSLNLGFGPWALPPGRLARSANQQPKATPPFDLVDNQDSLLDATDLVFIDPVGTGYSRILGRGKVEDFWNIDGDLESLAQFIQLWLNANDRWESPKFFLGESYGGTRAALLPNFLMGSPQYPGFMRGISLNGVVVLVNTLAWPLGGPGIGTAWQAATALPNQAAAAWYHQKIDRHGRTLSAFYAEVTEFALSQYAAALQKEADKTLSTQERAAIVDELVAFTGLPASAFGEKLSLSPWEFSSALLADRGLILGVFDSRYTLPSSAGVDPVAGDPALSRTFPVFTGAELHLERSKLQMKLNRPYAAIRWRDLLDHWSFEHRKNWSQWEAAGDGTPTTPAVHGTNAEELALAMNRNDHLYALVATGYYDLQMSPAQARLATERAKVPADRLILNTFEAGHEVYIDQANSGLVRDIRAMIARAAH